MEKLYKFLEKGNNKSIVKIVDVVVIAILSIITLYFSFNLLSADTSKNYLETTLNCFLYIAILTHKTGRCKSGYLLKRTIFAPLTSCKADI